MTIENELLKEADLAIRKYEKYIKTLNHSKTSLNEKSSGIGKLLYRDVGKYPVIKNQEVFSSLYVVYKEIEKYLKTRDSNNPELRNYMNDIKNRLLVPNIRFVKREAQKYKSLYKSLSLDVNDLTNEGSIGLLIAFEKYDPKRGSFLNYASWWIKHMIHKTLEDKSKLIRIPVNRQYQIKEIKRIKSDLEKISKRKPTIKELSHFTGISAKIIKEVENKGITMSLSFTEGLSFLDYFPDEKYKPEEKIIVHHLIKSLFKGAKISEREKRILWEKWIKGRTLREIGEDYNLTKERVRQLEKRALEKVRKYYKKINRLEKLR